MKARAQFLLLVAVFFLPVLLAIWLNGWWKPEATRNHGQLVQPVRHLVDFRVQTADGQWLREKDERGHWLLIQAVDGPCDPHCREIARLLRKLHVGLGEKAHRLRRILWTTGTDVTMEEWYAPPLRYLWPDGQAMVKASAGVLENLSGHEILLVDPRGWIALRYPAGFDIHGLRKDLNRLLTYAREDELTEIPPAEDT